VKESRLISWFCPDGMHNEVVNDLALHFISTTSS